VLQAIPSYAMSCFKLPVSLCKDFTHMIYRFWYGILKDRMGICWKAWDFLCRPKDVGDLGFRDFEAFNQAMLAKQLWRLFSRPSSLLARTFKGRYFPLCDVWKARLDCYPSFGWRSI
jgi:hypothetical protein